MKNHKKLDVDNPVVRKLTIPQRLHLMGVRAQIIKQLLDRGYRPTDIAIITNIDKGTISRLLKKWNRVDLSTN